MYSKFVNQIPEFNNIENYEICSDGTVISHQFNKIRILKPYPNTKGYPLVDLGTSRRAIKVHRLVALAFIPNPFNLPQVNHIDGCKTNNDVSNLEWVDNSGNQLHAFALGLNVGRRGNDSYQYDKEHHTCKKVKQIDIYGNVIAEYVSIASAARAIGLKSYTGIAAACKTGSKSGGFRWQYID